MKILLLSAVAACAMASSAHAATVFVGSWDVADAAAPRWDSARPNGPLAYTAQEAAALLFGGAAADYTISTAGANVANINNMAWYDQIGLGEGMFAENYSNKYLGLYYGPTDISQPGFASAFVRDNLEGLERINFAFRIDAAPAVPEPTTWAMMLAGFGAVGFGLRRRQQATVRVSFC